MVDERSLLQGLVQRGIPAHIAQGFVMNMRDESGLNPGINEVAPLVPGSRGGFGLYQLTGPRRVAYEQFAGNRGVDPADVDAQLDFLVSELQGPESRAAQSIFAAQDAPSAAVAIARDFLRPAPENLQKRVARYTGGTAMQPQGLLGTMSTRNAPEQEQLPFFQRPEVQDLFDTLAIGFGGMTLNPNQALIQAAQERIGARREERQTTAQLNKTLEYLRREAATNPSAAQALRYAEATGDVSGALKMATAQPERTALMQNYEYALSQNMTPEEARAWVSNATNITMPGDQLKIMPDGSVAVLDPTVEGGVRFVAPPGSKAAAEAQAAEERAQTVQSQGEAKESIISRDVKLLVDMIDQGGLFDLPEAGIRGNLLANLGINQEAVTFRNALNTIKANVAWDRLQQMRDASKTGGALGNVSEMELNLLMSSYGSLEQSNDPKVLRQNLVDINRIMTKIENDPVASRIYYSGGGAIPGGNAGNGSGVTVGEPY